MVRKHGGDRESYLEKYGRMPLDFSASVSHLGLSNAVLSAAEEALLGEDAYPDPECRALRQTLGEHHGTDPSMIMCGNGAADLIVRLAFALRPESALIPVPAFGEYLAALKMCGCSKIEEFPLKNEHDFIPDGDLLIRLGQDPVPELLFLCQPGNPSGRTIPPDLLMQIVTICRERKIRIVSDECFIDFLEDAPRYSLMSEIRDPGIIVLRAFTKFYGMAKLRLGYCISSDTELLEQMKQSGQPWPVSAPAMAAGIAALKEENYPSMIRLKIRTEREYVRVALEELGLRVIPGQANFLMFRHSLKDLAKRLEQNGILIRDCSDFSGIEKGWYRVSLRSREDNRKLVEAIKENTSGCI